MKREINTSLKNAIVYMLGALVSYGVITIVLLMFIGILALDNILLFGIWYSCIGFTFSFAVFIIYPLVGWKKCFNLGLLNIVPNILLLSLVFFVSGENRYLEMRMTQFFFLLIPIYPLLLNSLVKIAKSSYRFIICASIFIIILCTCNVITYKTSINSVRKNETALLLKWCKEASQNKIIIIRNFYSDCLHDNDVSDIKEYAAELGFTAYDISGFTNETENTATETKDLKKTPNIYVGKTVVLAPCIIASESGIYFGPLSSWGTWNIYLCLGTYKYKIASIVIWLS